MLPNAALASRMSLRAHRQHLLQVDAGHDAELAAELGEMRLSMNSTAREKLTEIVPT